MEDLKKFFGEFFSLKYDVASTKEIVERIHSGGVLKGTNMCILVLAIFIASIGLNMNSTAVIIGAMLISPLMGNIVSLGYGIAAYDTQYVKESFLKLSFQVFLSILTSTIYFSLTYCKDCADYLGRVNCNFRRNCRDYRFDTRRTRKCYSWRCHCNCFNAATLHCRLWNCRSLDNIFFRRTVFVFYKQLFYLSVSFCCVKNYSHTCKKLCF